MDIVESLGTDSPTSLPRSNGELVFKEPWESRAFGIAAALVELGVFEWSDFQASLIAAISDYEKTHDSIKEPYNYYERWFAALESLVIGKSLVSKQELDSLTTDFCKRPHGHDHDHDHGHSH
ncbi:MAG: nitrile hydratase accessory protein [Pacificibacter sp.]